MIKKVFFLLLVLMVADPAGIFACGCCPQNSPLAQTTGIEAADCGCCPSIQASNREASNLVQKEKPLSIFSKLLLFSPFETGSVFGAEFKAASPSGDLSPPFLFSETPLHLTIQILRI